MIKISQKAKYIVQIKVETGNIAGKMSSEDHLKKKKATKTQATLESMMVLDAMIMVELVRCIVLILPSIIHLITIGAPSIICLQKDVTMF